LIISGDIFISVERIRDNAKEYGVEFNEELIRVMAHGILHLLGYKDKSEVDSRLMRKKEEEMIELFHVEH
jgi:rRNA maturation RNase YbeY